MAIVKYKPEERPTPLTTPDTIVESPESNFTALVPVARVKELIKYAEGHPWTVDYYGILRRNGNTLENFDAKTLDNVQSYYKIDKLILQVDSPLSSSYDDTTGISSVTGSSILPLGLKPNVGDTFLANVDSGEDAWFNVTSVERVTYTKETLYLINYELQVYANQDPHYQDTINRRVNSTYHYNKDTNYFNRDILVSTEVHKVKQELSLFLHQSIEYYLDTFCRAEAGTLFIPGTSSFWYDPLILDFIQKTVSGDVLIDRRLSKYEHLDRYINQPSIWDLLLKQNLNYVSTTNKKYAFINPQSLTNRARLGTMVHTPVSKIIYPMDPDNSVYTSKSRPMTGVSNNEKPNTSRNYYLLNDLVANTSNNNNTYTLPILHPLFEEGYYVVSGRFYEYLDNHFVGHDLSYIELIIAKFLRKEAISKIDLYTAVKDHSKWSRLHQFYLLPVMWHIIRTQM